MLGTGTAQDLNLQLPIHPRIRVKKIRFVQPGWRQKLQYTFYFFWTLYWTLRWKPQWIYASDMLSCPGVWLLQRLTSVHVLYHEHDTPFGNQEVSWFMRTVLAFREKVGREASICVLPQRERLMRFKAETGRTKPIFCVWNCPRKEEIPSHVIVHDYNPMVLYYHGSISPVRLPRSAVAAVRRFGGKMRLRVAGYETVGNNYLAELGHLTPQGTPHLIELLGTLRRTELFRAASASHVGLCLMPTSTENLDMHYMVGASNKAFDYMACGLPLLVSDLPEWVATFVRPGFALACNPDDPDSIEAALRWYLEHPEERREMGRRCQEKIGQAWNYETMFAGVLAELEKDVKREIVFARQGGPESVGRDI
jgi:glycosyltransferase involved in cell wall biosynthesis